MGFVPVIVVRVLPVFAVGVVNVAVGVVIVAVVFALRDPAE